MEFAGKVALVTGAGRGIGAATALAFAREGADVALLDLNPVDSIASEIRSLGRRCVAFQGDVCNADGMERIVAETVQQLGVLDVFVANAAYQHRDSFWKIPREEFERVIAVTMWGPLWGLRAAAKPMMERKSGCIVVISSGHAEVPHPRSMPYNMAKAADDQMARTAAVELFEFSVRVNIVYPGWTDTPGERKFFTEEQLATIPLRTPGKRLARPDEIARGVLFLASPKSEFINGHTLDLSGGLNLRKPWNT